MATHGEEEQESYWPAESAIDTGVDLDCSWLN